MIDADRMLIEEARVRHAVCRMRASPPGGRILGTVKAQHLEDAALFDRLAARLAALSEREGVAREEVRKLVALGTASVALAVESGQDLAIIDEVNDATTSAILAALASDHSGDAG